MRALYAHDGACRGLVVTFDGLVLATVGDDGLVRCWDVPGERVIPELAHDGPVQVVAASGTTLAAACGARLRFWNALSGWPMGQPSEQAAPVIAGAYSASGSVFVTSDGNEVFPWRAATMRQRGRWSSPGLIALAPSPDGSLLAWSDGDTVRVSELLSGRERWSAPYAARSLCWSVRPAVLHAGGPQGIARLVEGSVESLHGASATDLDVHPRGTTVWAVDGGCWRRLADEGVLEGEVDGEAIAVRRHPDREAAFLALADGRVLAVGPDAG